MTERRCGSCIWWDQAANPLSTAGRHVKAAPALGVCRYDRPVVVQSKWFPVTMQPETHESCRCSWWDGGDDGTDDDGERSAGSGEPAPEETTVVPFTREAA